VLRQFDKAKRMSVTVSSYDTPPFRLPKSDVTRLVLSTMNAEVQGLNVQKRHVGVTNTYSNLLGIDGDCFHAF
jgi:hypothetical protein